MFTRRLYFRVEGSSFIEPSPYTVFHGTWISDVKFSSRLNLHHAVLKNYARVYRRARPQWHLPRDPLEPFGTVGVKIMQDQCTEYESRWCQNYAGICAQNMHPDSVKIMLRFLGGCAKTHGFKIAPGF